MHAGIVRVPFSVHLSQRLFISRRTPASGPFASFAAIWDLQHNSVFWKEVNQELCLSLSRFLCLSLPPSLSSLARSQVSVMPDQCPGARVCEGRSSRQMERILKFRELVASRTGARFRTAIKTSLPLSFPSPAQVRATHTPSSTEGPRGTPVLTVSHGLPGTSITDSLSNAHLYLWYVIAFFCESMFCRKCMCNKTSFLSDFARLTELGGFPRTSPCPRATVLLCASDDAATLSFPRRGPAASCLLCERDEESKSRVEGPAHCSCCSSAMSSCDSPSTLLLLAPCNSSCARRKVTASVIAASPIAFLPRKTPKTGSCLGEQVLKLLETPKELTGQVERFLVF